MDAPVAAPSRRSLLKKGLLGGAVLALGGVGLFGWNRSLLAPLPTEGLRVLTPGEYSLIRAVALRLVPVRPDFPSVDEVRVAFNADRALERADPSAQRELKQLLGLFENGLTALLFTGRPTPFTRLSAEGQDEVLRGWYSSQLAIRRTGMQALRSLILASYYGSPLTWRAVG